MPLRIGHIDIDVPCREHKRKFEFKRTYVYFLICGHHRQHTFAESVEEDEFDAIPLGSDTDYQC